MPIIDRAVIQHVAELASLSLTDAEGERLTHEVGTILKYIGELDSLDTSDVPPTAQVGLRGDDAGNALRSDEVQPCLSHEEALAQAPRAAQGGFAVPAFVEGGATETSRRGQP
jgi:aspartyl-tRNA(Asn)/glutamyl-tRNA(Gln) amidotransferase subunit C